MRSVTVLVFVALNVTWVRAQPNSIFDDFEADLGMWTGKAGGSHTGVIVPDPLNPSNSVLTFSDLTASGDVFSSPASILPGELYQLTFDYLGLPLVGSPPGNLGGFIGISNSTSGPLHWMAGTILDENNPANAILVELDDDGLWHSYSVVFRPNEYVSSSSTQLRIMVEDWNGAGCATCPVGVPGDAFFDNVGVHRFFPLPTEVSSWGAIKALYSRD